MEAWNVETRYAKDIMKNCNILNKSNIFLKKAELRKRLLRRITFHDCLFKRNKYVPIKCFHKPILIFLI